MKTRHLLDDRNDNESQGDFDLHTDSAPLEHASLFALQPLQASFVWMPSVEKPAFQFGKANPWRIAGPHRRSTC